MFTLICLGAAALLIAAGIWMLRTGRRGQQAAVEFVRTGVRTRATVVELRTRTIHQGDAGVSSNRPYVHPVVEFRTPDGRTVRAESMTGSTSTPARVGESIDVVHDRDRPERVALASGLGAPGTTGAFQVAVGSVMCLIGTVAVGFWALIKLVLRVPV